MKQDLGVVVAAGGSSSRFGSENKLFSKINGVPVVVHSVKAFLAVVEPASIVVTVPENDVESFKSLFVECELLGEISIVPGGDSRMKSVFNGLAALPECCDYVAIHDGARPLVTETLINSCYDGAVLYKAAIPGRPVTDTLKKCDANGFIVDTVDRSVLVGVETPQTFHRKTLLEGYTQANRAGVDVTDDAGVMEFAGYSPFIVVNHESNMKITYAEDLIVAEALLSVRN